MAIALMHHDQRPQHGDDAPDRRAEHQRRPVRPGERDVLRDHLAEHDVQVDHDRQRDHERDRVQQAVRHVQRRASTGSTRCATAGSPTAPRTSEQTVMPSWLTADHQGDVLHRLERGPRHPRAGLGARLDLAAPGGDQGELGADEERVAEQQDDGERRRRSGCSSRPPPLGRAPSSRRQACSRSMRRPSIRSTVRTASCSRGSSGSERSGTGDLGEVADARAPGRAPAAPGRRSCRSPRGRAARSR